MAASIYCVPNYLSLTMVVHSRPSPNSIRGYAGLVERGVIVSGGSDYKQDCINVVGRIVEQLLLTGEDPVGHYQHYRSR